MIGIILLFVVTLLLNNMILSALKRRHTFLNKRLLNGLYFYHLVFFGIYYAYAYFNPSDSKQYYFVLQTTELSWLELSQIKNGFMYLVGYPFVRYFAFSYEMMMLLFAWFGYVGFVYAYMFFRENIPVPVKVFSRFNLLTFLLFLPNMHFWTASLGKGSIIFMGIMLFAYAIKNPKKRWFTLVLGTAIVYGIRPHVMLFMLSGVMFGLLFGREKISFARKFILISASIVFLVAASGTILAVAGLDESENIVEDFNEFSSWRSSELARTAGSGVAIANYPLPLKLATFWFRPLFFDAPSLLGIITSFENLLYVLLFVKIANKRFWRFIKNAPYMVKMAAITFLTTSFAMTFVMSNLGIIMRQKTMVMYFGFFVIYYFLAEEKYNKIQNLKKQMLQQNKVQN